MIHMIFARRKWTKRGKCWDKLYYEYSWNKNQIIKYKPLNKVEIWLSPKLWNEKKYESSYYNPKTKNGFGYGF